MKRLFLLSIVFMLIIPVLAAEIEPNVFEKVRNDQKVRVIVIIDAPVQKVSTNAFEANTLISRNVIRELDNFEVLHTYSSFPGFSGYVSKKDLDKLKQIPGVKVYADEPAFQISLSESVPHIRANDAWSIQIDGTNITGKGETVCIIDTGVNASHPALAGRVVAQHDFCADNTDCTTEDDKAEDEHGHGTHVAGIIASNDSTYAGVAPEANIVAMKAANSAGTLFIDAVAASLDWCTANKTLYNISIISMSFGNEGKYDSIASCPSNVGNLTLVSNALNAAYNNNIMLVAASGNEGHPSGINYPACHQNVTAVGATDNSDSIAAFSNSGNLLDLLAPGVSIKSTYKDGNFATLSGTSMATPHVSGAAVLLRQYMRLKLDKILTPAEIEDKLVTGGVEINDTRNGLVFPRVDIINALAPAVTIESPLNQTYDIKDLDFNITVEHEIESAEVSVDGVNYTLTNDTLLHWYNTSVPALVVGHHTAVFAAVSTDFITTEEILFEIDSTPPNIILNSPANGSAAARGDVINLTITDNFGINSVWYERNFTNTTIVSSYDNYLINTTIWSKGLQSIVVFANDTTSNLNHSAFVFTINNSQPILTALTSGKLKSTVTLSAIAIDDDGAADISSVKFYYSNDSMFSLIGAANATGDMYSLSWNTSLISDGSYKLIANATDNSSSSNLREAAISIDNINDPPSITLTKPVGGETWSGTKLIEWNATDPNSDVLKITIYYGEGGENWNLIVNGTANDGEHNFDTTTVTNGEHYRINVTATDTSGLTATAVSGNFTVSNSGSNSVTNTNQQSSDSGGGSLVTATAEEITPAESTQATVESENLTTQASEQETKAEGLTGFATAAIKPFLESKKVALVIGISVAVIAVAFASAHFYKPKRPKSNAQRSVQNYYWPQQRTQNLKPKKENKEAPDFGF